MTDEKNGPLENIIMTRLIRLNAVVTGLVLGVLVGGAIFLATMILVVKGGDVVGPHLSLLGQFYWGYTVTIGGGFIGLFYGFLTGFITGYLVAALYNFFLSFRSKNQRQLN